MVLGEEVPSQEITEYMFGFNGIEVTNSWRQGAACIVGRCLRNGGEMGSPELKGVKLVARQERATDIL